MSTFTVDRQDLALLDALQRSGNATNATLGEQVHLSASQVSRRLQRLQEGGLIAGYAALLNPAAVGLGVTAFAHVVLERQGGARSEAFEASVAGLPEVLECFSVSGNADYVLRLVAPDLAAFSELMMKRVLCLPGIANVKTDIVLGRVKQTHVLPLDHITQPSQPRQRVRFSGG
ncbi:MAG TPA: AsnC family transcriptional regulator [Thauera sp.]|jgi:DNA-binding Lrp family transcriptional regulator|nr:AsnC family transcriptional regulator [Thauera sp.]